MEFRKMVMMTLYVRQQKRYRCKEKTLDSVGEGEGGMIWKNSIETCILSLKHVYYMWNRSPVQVQCIRQGAQGWCTGMTLRDAMGREVGERVRMGNTCTPMADLCQGLAKTTTTL